MVDALREAHRAVKRGGVVIDARPDYSRLPRLTARGKVRGHIVQTADANDRDARSDAAVARVVAAGLFRVIEQGRVWHSSTFRDVSELDAYLADSGRYDTYERGTRKALLPFRRGPIQLRRAIKFQVLARL